MPAVLLLGITGVSAADFSVYGTLTTEYIYRGLSMTARNPAIQLGADFSFNEHLFAGAWVSTVDLRNANGGRDFQSYSYAGFQFPINDRLTSTFTLVRYGYPGADGIHDYDYNEALIILALDARYAIEFAYTNDLSGLGNRATHVLLSADWPLKNGWVLGANLGQNDMSSTGIPDYLHGNIGLSTRVRRYTFDVRLYGIENTNSVRLDRRSAGTRLALSVSAAF